MKLITTTMAALMLLIAAIGAAGALTPEREEAIRECSEFQSTHPHSYSGKQFHSYRACMATRGQPE